MAKINQKEYLKKYLGGTKTKKKKQKTKNIKLMDDDDDNKFIDFDNDLFDLKNEDAPQIVSITEDKTKPVLDSFGVRVSDVKWKSITESPATVNLTQNDVSPSRRNKSKGMKAKSKKNTENKKNNDGDLSPARNKPRETNNSKYNDDLSPPRKSDSRSSSLQRNYRKHDDLSPPRKSNSRVSPSHRNDRNYDLSPPRKSNRRASPSHRNDRNYDLSPPRKSNSRVSPSHRNDRNYDLSPPRKSKSRHLSPETNNRKFNDLSPPRKSRTRVIMLPQSNKDETPPKISNEPSESTRKFGLHSASALNESKRNEFDESQNEISERDAEPIVRNCRNRKVDEKPDDSLKKENMKKAKLAYSRWGKGVSQVEDYKKKLEEDMYEGSKPFARYSNDQDLDEFLKSKDRDGDPMLAYIQQNRLKNGKNNEPTIPIYKGIYPENRFNLMPGYRWDGVDRSNGYEKKYFDVQNSKKSGLEDAYKYSCEDM